MVCSFCIFMDDLPYLTNHFENKNWDTFYSNSSINDVKNVFLYAFCKNDLEMWHKWFLNTRQGSNRVPHSNAMLNWCTQASMSHRINIEIFNRNCIFIIRSMKGMFYMFQLTAYNFAWCLVLILIYIFGFFNNTLSPQRCEPKLLR